MKGGQLQASNNKNSVCSKYFMVYSMTGFGRGEAENEYIKFTVEIKSVNHRYSDIIVKGGKRALVFEENIKNIIKNYITRGRIEVYINYEKKDMNDYKIVPDYQLMDEYHSVLRDIIKRYDLRDDVSVGLVSKFPEAIKLEANEADESVIWSCLEESCESAIKKLVEMRKIEGEKLVSDIIMRKQLIEDNVNRIEEISPEIVASHKTKMIERIKDLLEGEFEVDDSRISQEIAIYADKTSITEEIVRLRSHLNQLVNILDNGGAIGRKLDFLLQEMNREVNTIGSKSPDIDISNYVISMKSELEKIREQIQNIE